MTLQVRSRSLAGVGLGDEPYVTEIAKLQAELAPWTSHTSRGKLRAISDDHTFSVK